MLLSARLRACAWRPPSWRKPSAPHAGREAEALPPILPPLRRGEVSSACPRPEPLFLPPPVSLFTVAQARRSASLLGNASLLIALFDMLGLAFLLVGVAGFIPAWHLRSSEALGRLRTAPVVRCAVPAARAFETQAPMGSSERKGRESLAARRIRHGSRREALAGKGSS